MIEIKNNKIIPFKNKAKRDWVNVNVNVKKNDVKVNVNATGKGVFVAGFVAVLPSTLCILGGSFAIYSIGKKIAEKYKKV